MITLHKLIPKSLSQKQRKLVRKIKTTCQKFSQELLKSLRKVRNKEISLKLELQTMKQPVKQSRKKK